MVNLGQKQEKRHTAGDTSRSSSRTTWTKSWMPPRALPTSAARSEEASISLSIGIFTGETRKSGVPHSLHHARRSGRHGQSSGRYALLCRHARRDPSRFEPGSFSVMLEQIQEKAAYCGLCATLVGADDTDEVLDAVRCSADARGAICASLKFGQFRVFRPEKRKSDIPPPPGCARRRGRHGRGPGRCALLLRRALRNLKRFKNRSAW